MNLKKILENFFLKKIGKTFSINKKYKKNEDFWDNNYLIRILILIFIEKSIGLIFKTIYNFAKIILLFGRVGNKNKYLICPMRGIIGTKIYDEIGNFSEEYYRINLINSLLKKGFLKKNLELNHRIKIGHKGKNSIIPDIVVTNKNNKGFFLVVEVKKNSNKVHEALDYQLKPVMKILEPNYGIYYDGTKESRLLLNNGSLIKNFDFLNLPGWFIDEWKKT